MGTVTYVAYELSEQSRVGGYYATTEDLELAARFFEFDVIVGPIAPLGYFMTMSDKTTPQPKEEHAH